MVAASYGQESRARLPPGTQALGQSEGMSWGSVDALELARTLPAAGEGLSLLYLTETAYREAVRDLALPETRAVVAARSKMDDTQLSDMVDELGDAMGLWGAWAARERGQAGGGFAKTWEAVASALDAAHRQAYEMGRPIEWGLPEIVTVHRWLATLLALEQELAGTSSVPNSPGNTAVAQTQGELAEVAALLGEPAYREAPARDQEPRAVLTPKGDPMLLGRVKRGELPAETWLEFWIVGLSPEDAAVVTKLPGNAILYLSMEDYFRVATRLTSAQRDRDLAERKREGRPGPEDYSRRMVTLRLRVIAHLAAVMRAMPPDTPEATRVRALLGSARKREMMVLATSSPPPARWPDALEQMAARLRILRHFSAQRGRNDIERWCDENEAALRAAAGLLRSIEP